MQRSKIEQQMINRLIIRWTPDNYIWYSFCGVCTKNVWWGNQGILGVGNRHDNMNTLGDEEAECEKSELVTGRRGITNSP